MAAKKNGDGVGSAASALCDEFKDLDIGDGGGRAPGGRGRRGSSRAGSKSSRENASNPSGTAGERSEVVDRLTRDEVKAGQQPVSGRGRGRPKKTPGQKASGGGPIQNSDTHSDSLSTHPSDVGALPSPSGKPSSEKPQKSRHSSELYNRENSSSGYSSLSSSSSGSLHVNSVTSTTVSRFPSSGITFIPNLNDVFKRIESLLLHRDDEKKSNAKIVNDIVTCLEGKLEHIGESEAPDNRPDKSWNSCKTGSYYEQTKIYRPDEYDCMFECKFRHRRDQFEALYYPEIQMKPSTKSYCALKLKSTFTLTTDLCSRKARSDRESSDRYLSPKSFLKFFRERVEGLLKPMQDHIGKGFSIVMKNEDLGPAVTIVVENRPMGKKISIDLVPAILITEWPKPAENWTCKWKKNVQANSFYAIPKIHPSEYATPADQSKLFRMSFSHIEKELVLHADGKPSSEGAVAYHTSRKRVLLLLKEDLEEINSPVQKDDKCVCSYYLKTIWLHLNDIMPDDACWKEDQLPLRYVNALESLVDALERKYIPHYFIAGENLLSLKPHTEKLLEEVSAHFRLKLEHYKRT